MDAPKQIMDLFKFALQNCENMGDDMSSYVEAQVQEIILGIPPESEP